MRFFLNKMVSLCDIHWGNFNKFAKFVKMARVQRVNSPNDSSTGRGTNDVIAADSLLQRHKAFVVTSLATLK
jgi:hypothetical protein